MTLTQLDQYLNSFLRRELYQADPSRNGIQIQNSSPDEKQIRKVAFATDACEATAIAAAKEGADVLFVHHGIFWGRCEPLTQSHYKRVAAFMRNDLALYASHIPLDANVEVGNNYGIARRMGLSGLEPFGTWHGMTLGVRGTLGTALSPEETAARLFPDGEKPARILAFGKKQIQTVAIISGGAGEDVVQAYEAGVDAYITGEIEHEQYHLMEELGMTVIAGGHYQTETVGVRLVQQKLLAETGIPGVFIDIPTGL